MDAVAAPESRILVATYSGALQKGRLDIDLGKTIKALEFGSKRRQREDYLKSEGLLQRAVLSRFLNGEEAPSFLERFPYTDLTEIGYSCRGGVSIGFLQVAENPSLFPPIAGSPGQIGKWFDAEVRRSKGLSDEPDTFSLLIGPKTDSYDKLIMLDCLGEAAVSIPLNMNRLYGRGETLEGLLGEAVVPYLRPGGELHVLELTDEFVTEALEKANSSQGAGFEGAYKTFLGNLGFRTDENWDFRMLGYAGDPLAAGETDGYVRIRTQK